VTAVVAAFEGGAWERGATVRLEAVHVHMYVVYVHDVEVVVPSGQDYYCSTAVAAPHRRKIWTR
jgi:hypothetical protein